MRDVVKTEIIIFSVERKGLTEGRNAEAVLNAAALLEAQEIPFIKALGKYSGTTEQSFVVVRTPNNERAVRGLCRMYNQECYLVSGKDRVSDLVYLDNRPTQTIGVLQRVNDDYSDNYTLVDGVKWAALW